MNYFIVLAIIISGTAMYIWYTRNVYTKRKNDYENTCREDFDVVIGVMTRIIAHSDLFDDLAPEHREKLCRRLIKQKINDVYERQCEEFGDDVDFDLSVLLDNFRGLSAEILKQQLTLNAKEERRQSRIAQQNAIAAKAAEQRARMLSNRHELARNLLLLDLKSNNREQVKRSLNEYRAFCRGHQDSVDMDKKIVRDAQKYMIALSFKPRLLHAIGTQNVENIKEIVESIEHTGTDYMLQDELKSARDRVNQLTKLLGGDNKTADRDALKEIKLYKNPPKIVHDILLATLIVLGEDEQRVHYWRTCKAFFTVGIYKRMAELRLEDFPQWRAKRALEILSAYDEQTCAEISSAGSTFYKWAKDKCVDRLNMSSTQKVENHQDGAPRARLKSKNLFMPRRTLCTTTPVTRPSSGPSPGQRIMSTLRRKSIGPSLEPERRLKAAEFIPAGKKPSDPCLIDLSQNWEPPPAKFVFPHSTLDEDHF